MTFKQRNIMYEKLQKLYSGMVAYFFALDVIQKRPIGEEKVGTAQKEVGQVLLCRTFKCLNESILGIHWLSVVIAD